MLSFIKWIRSYTIIGVPINEKLVLDEIACDESFPETVRKYVILDYLDSKSFGKRKINIVDAYYNEYIKYISFASDPER